MFLCGNPTPEVIWKVDNRSLNGTVEEVDEETELFKYTLDFKNYLQPKKCSVKVSLMAQGHFEEEKVFQSEIQYGGEQCFIIFYYFICIFKLIPPTIFSNNIHQVVEKKKGLHFYRVDTKTRQ